MRRVGGRDGGGLSLCKKPQQSLMGHFKNISSEQSLHSWTTQKVERLPGYRKSAHNTGKQQTERNTERQQINSNQKCDQCGSCHRSYEVNQTEEECSDSSETRPPEEELQVKTGSATPVTCEPMTWSSRRPGGHSLEPFSWTLKLI